ncbi:MAG TPA: DUF262 domain-containing protein [Bacteroidales bacterium]|nr:DUF262 domain-containing protein [Bacteroidales bacterium]
MGYESKSIRQVMLDIESNKIYLPALQRKFVWGKYQIQLLFDSLMRNFPIGTFLFWKLHKNKAESYVFYEFLKEYDQRSPFNRRKTGSFLWEEITGVLDGQQRLSSMYIGMQGTHTEKAPYKRQSSADAYPKTSLFLNLLSLPYFLTENNSIAVKEEQNFEFAFLTENESNNYISRRKRITNEEGIEVEKEEVMFWFKVGKVLSWEDDPEFEIIIDGFSDLCRSDTQKKELEKARRFIRKCLETLHKRIFNEQLINYFEISKDDLEDILKIFIRVNSGGTVLNKTDLLFSTIVATWNDGREEIEELQKKINDKGEKFNFSNEYLMRCCLVLTDAPVLYKVNSFKVENVQKIKDEWPKIADAINKTVDLLVEFGFSSSLLTSQNATIIIAYYIYKGGDLSVNSRKALKKYLVHALLNGIYGSSQDQIIAFLRNALRSEKKTESGKVYFDLISSTFSFDNLLSLNLPSRKSLYVTETEIDQFLTYKKGAGSFFVLTLLYPNLKYNEIQFHQDHIHPAAHFTTEILNQMQIPAEQHAEWYNLKDMIPNLQLMEGRQNESKNSTEFIKWLSQKGVEEQNAFCLSNYIPTNTEHTFKNFKDFFAKRKTKLKEELLKVLAVNNSIPVPEIEYIQEEEEEMGTLSID